MARCNELCTKETTGQCALCDTLAERERFIQRWLKGGFLLDGVRTLKRGRVVAYLHRYAWLMVRLQDRSKAPRCWWSPVPHGEVRHKDVVRETHKQYSETLNKTMLTLLAVALFCLLTTLGSPDKLLLAADSTIKVPFADAPMSFLGFIVVAPLLLIVLAIYLHVFYGYWLACEQERQYINQRLIPPIESIPTLFSFPDTVPRVLTGVVFYWLVPLVLLAITWKAWALPAMGLPLTYVASVVTLVLVLLQIRRRPDHQRQWWTLLGYTILVLIIGLMVRVTFNPQSFRRPLNLFRAELSKALLMGINMLHASAGFANLQGAQLWQADLRRADLHEADLEGANLVQAKLQGAQLRGARLSQAKLFKADFQEADLQGAQLQGAQLYWTQLSHADLLGANLQGAALIEAQLQNANLGLAQLQNAQLQGAQLQNANLLFAQLQNAQLQNAQLQNAQLHGANLQNTILSEANLQRADLQNTILWGADLSKAKNLTQDQINETCIDENTKFPEGLTRPAQGVGVSWKCPFAKPR